MRLLVGLNQDQNLTPAGPEAREPHPQEAVSGVKGDALATDLALQHEQLVARGHDLDSKRGGTPEEVGERQEQSAKRRTHVAPTGSGP